MSDRVRIALVVLTLLQALGCVACFLLAIWGGDDRWGYTAGLLFVTTCVTGAVAI